jgi:hypothetical protein
VKTSNPEHLPLPVQSPYFRIIELLWTVLDAGLKNPFPLPTSLKKLGESVPMEWHTIALETAHNLYEYIPNGIVAVLKAKH